jgi:predicted SAM-dependent methyltransferase
LFSPPLCFSGWFDRRKIRYILSDYTDRAADMNVDVMDMPFGDGELDFISCDHILEHVEDYKAALRELFRVVKPGGVVEITVPLLPELEETMEDAAVAADKRRETYGQADHLRIFGRDFAEILKAAGFAVTVYDGDACDERLVPVVAPFTYDYNKVFICGKEMM